MKQTYTLALCPSKPMTIAQASQWFQELVPMPLVPRDTGSYSRNPTTMSDDAVPE